MDTVNKIFETAKVLLAPVFAIFALWLINPPADEGTVKLILEMLQALVILIGGLIGGSGVSRLRRAYKEAK